MRADNEKEIKRSQWKGKEKKGRKKEIRLA